MAKKSKIARTAHPPPPAPRPPSNRPALHHPPLSPPPAAATEDRTAAKADPSPARGPRARARAKYRRDALAWDRTEFRTVGTPGPDVRTAEHHVEVPGHPAVRVRIYYPPAASDAPVPAVLAFFGGAFRIGGIDYPNTDA